MVYDRRNRRAASLGFTRDRRAERVATLGHGLRVHRPRPRRPARVGTSEPNSPRSPGAIGATSDQPRAPQPEQERPALWSPVAEDTLPRPNRTWRVTSANYRTVRLDRRGLADLLARALSAGTDEARKTDVLLELPGPDGSFRTYHIEKLSFTEPGGWLKCPDLQTYWGRTNDRPDQVVLEWSNAGLYAKTSADPIMHIQPYAPGDAEHYIVYYTRDWSPGPESSAGSAASQAAPGQPTAVPSRLPALVEEIAVDRRSTAYQGKLTLSRNGVTMLTTVGILGADHMCRGTVKREDFAQLAALIENERFVDLNEAYASSAVDGECVTTSVIIAGQRKAVRDCNDGGPSNLTAIEDAITALGNKVIWTDARR